jgi:hypothetical protein
MALHGRNFEIFRPFIFEIETIARKNISNYLDKWETSENMADAHNDTLEQYKSLNKSNESTFFATWQMKYYIKNIGHFKSWHVDRYIGLEKVPGTDGNEKFLSERIFIVMTYLNDVEEGGETQFLYSDLKLKPKKGTMVIWPAQWPWVHRGNIPTSNDKYLLNGWLQSAMEGGLDSTLGCNDISAKKLSDYYNKRISTADYKYKKTKPIIYKK